MPRPTTLAKQRLTGEKPYKVPPTDGRRARYAGKRIPISTAAADALESSFRVAIHQTFDIRPACP